MGEDNPAILGYDKGISRFLIEGSMHTHFPASKQLGFTLVELSIVLVILGLLVGGVLTGQSLIRAAELRTVATEYSKYQTALNTFKDKYFSMPGDMNNAVSYWTQAANCPGTASQGSTTTATCNGNGDGLLTYNSGSNEHFRFWQHLANAGLIEGTFSGVTGTDSYQWYAVRTNSPVSKVQNGSYWAVANVANNSSGQWDPSVLFSASLGNIMALGTPNGTAYPWVSSPILKPEEAYNIDMKMDDGKPLRGKMMASATTACSGVSNGSGSTGTDYALSTTTKACMIYFPQAF